jgi:hypothetical protein
MFAVVVAKARKVKLLGGVGAALWGNYLVVSLLTGFKYISCVRQAVGNYQQDSMCGERRVTGVVVVGESICRDVIEVSSPRTVGNTESSDCRRTPRNNHRGSTLYTTSSPISLIESSKDWF